MREQLVQYVTLLFAGAPDTDEIRAEILQNTLDRYDDLVAQGKSPEAAYRLAISGIGDISEILGAAPKAPACSEPAVKKPAAEAESEEDIKKKKTRAIAVALYIVCAVPLFALSDLGNGSIGLCLTLALVAYATYLMIISGKKDDGDEGEKKPATPRKELNKSINNLIWAIGLAVYIIVSFSTDAWYITWILFPIIGCVEGLMKAIVDLKEANKYEK